MGRIIFIALTALLLLQSSCAHAFRLFHHLDVTDGLPSYQSYVVAQDKEGLIWIGTENGLARYDGNTVEVFQHQANVPNSLSGNSVRSLLIDHDGHIWIGTDAGLDVYQSDGGFRHITLGLPNHDTPAQDKISAIIQSHDGHIWVGGNTTGLYVLAKTGTLIRHYQQGDLNASSLSNNSVKALYEDKHDQIWIGTLNGLDVLNETSGNIKYHFHTTDPKSISNNKIYAITGSNDGGLWVGTFSGLNHTTDNANSFTRYLHAENNPESLPNNFIHALLLDKNGQLWVSTYLAGLAELNPKNATFTVYKHTLTNPYSIEDSDVWGMMLDASDTLWVATDNGISFTNLHNIPLTYIVPSSHDAGSSLSSPPNILVASLDSLLIGVNSGLDIYNVLTGSFQHILLSSVERNSTHISFSSDTVTAILARDSAHIFLGTLNGNIIEAFNNKHDRFSYNTYSSNLIHGSVLTFLALTRNRLIFSTTGGDLFIFDTKRHDFFKVQVRPNLAHSYISVIAHGPSNTLLLGTNSSLYLYRLESDTKAGEAIRLHDGVKLINKPILSINKHSASSYWFGTANGLDKICLSDEGQLITCKSNTETILDKQRIKGIEADSRGTLWLDTGIGLYEFSPDTGLVRDFGSAQGLPFENFFERSYAKTTDGRLWFGGNGGIIGLQPLSMPSITIAPVSVITKVTSRTNKLLSKRQKPQAGKLIVNYIDRNLTIAYTVADYSSPRANRFKYRLFGFDQSWIDAGNSHTVTYTNLNPGHYEFEVRGANNWGVWSKQPAILDIIVMPPWWRTWWAYFVYTLMILGTMFAYVHAQQRKLHREREINAKLRDADAIKSNFVSELETQVSKATGDLKDTLEAVNLKNQELEIAHKRASEGEQLKSQFLANMSHELRTPLTAILGYLKLLLQTSATTEQAEYLRTVQHSSESLLAIINDTLDLSRIESGKLLIDEVDLNLLDLIESTIELLGPSAYLKHITLLRIVPPEIPLSLRGDPLRIRQILTNLVGNAIKFTQSGSVCIRVQEIERREREVMLGIAISDTGIGIPAVGIAKLFNAYARHESAAEPATEGTGLGLSICKKLLDLMGGEIEVLSTPGVGSTFEFRLAFKIQKQPTPLVRYPEHIKIALLDNHPLSHQAWRASLARLGFDVVAIRNPVSLKERNVTALVIALSPEDIERINEASIGMDDISIPHLVLAPTADRRTLDMISEACQCRTQNTLIRESVLLSEISTLIPLPQVPKVDEQNHAPLHDNKYNKDDQRRLILVADDNAINRKLLVTILLQNGYRVAEAASGEEFLELASGELWDAALVDIHMPDMDGMEATRRLLSMRLGIQSPIIAVSADALPDTRTNALAAGMRDYLVKPYSEEQLLEVLQRYLPNPDAKTRN